MLQRSTTNSQFQQSSRHQIMLNPQSSHLSFSTAGQKSRKQVNLLGNSNSILKSTAPSIKSRQLQSHKKFHDDLLSKLHIDLCQSNGKLLHQQMYEFSSSAQLHQRKLESQQSLVKLRDLQSNKVLEAIQKGQMEQSNFNRTQKNKLATEVQQKELAFETQFLPTSATRAQSQLSKSVVEIDKPYNEVSFRSMVLQVPRTDDEIYKSLEQQERESQRSNSVVRRSAFMSPSPHKSRKSARKFYSSCTRGKERPVSGKTLIKQGKQIHYLVRKKNEEFKNVGPKKIKYEYNKFLFGYEFNLDRYMGCEYKLDDGRMILPKRRPRYRRKKSAEPIKEPTPRPPTPKKRELTEKERIDLKNKMFLDTINKIAPTCEDSDDIKEALDSDNHWKNLAGFSAFGIRLKMLRRMNQKDGHVEHLKNRQVLVCQFFHDISRYLIKALLRQPSLEVKYHEIGFKAFLDYIEFAKAEPQLFPELAYEILVADFHSLMLQLAADKEMLSMLEFFWQYMEKLAKSQTKEHVEMLKQLKLADIMVAHTLSVGKVSFRIMQSITSIIQRTLLERTTCKEVAHKLIECLLRAFNRQGEDKSVVFRPKEVELHWFEKEERKKRRKRNRIWDEYTQNKIDRNALWAMQGYCSYSYAHSISFLEALEQRRTEFTRKCSRILMDYADSKIEQEEDKNSDEEVKHKNDTETQKTPISSDSIDKDLTSEQLKEQEIKEEDSDLSYERQRKEEKVEQWTNIVKPCLSLLARLNTVSDDFAHHFITGKQKTTFKDGQVVGITRVIHKEPRNVAKVLITDYLTKVSDVNAMRAGLHALQMALKWEYGGRDQQLTLNKAQKQWRQVEHQMLADELYELFQSCKMVSRLPIILSAETAMNEGLDPVYAGHLLHFIRTLFIKTVDVKNNEQELKCMLSLAKTVMITLPQQITSMENGATYKIARTHKTESAVQEVINVLEYITDFDKGLVRQFFRVSDAYLLLNIAKLQYKSASSGLAHRVCTILRLCYKESAISTPKEALFDLLTSPMSDKSKF